MSADSVRRIAPVLRTPACDLLGITHPVALGGMTGHTSSELVAAVSNAGGLGTFGASGFTRERVLEQASRIRHLTHAPFALNLLLFRSEDQLDVVIEARPPVLAFAWAAADQDLRTIFGKAHDAGARVMYQAASVSQAIRAAEAGADVIVAQGSEGGGHVGVMGTMPLVPMVVDAVRPKPVLAAGGVADGRGLAAALALGADGVLLGTRFLATAESPLHAQLKQAILDSDGHDTDLTTLPDVMTGRIWPGALARVGRNAFIRRWAGREWELRLRRQEVSAETAAARETGDADGAVLFYGQDAGLIHTIEPAGTIVNRIVEEAYEIMTRRLPSLRVERAAGS